MKTLMKWLATMRISWRKQLSYKLNLLLLVVGPSVVFFFVKYSLWTAIFSMPGVAKIQGYDRSGMLDYQIWSLIVAFLVQGYNSMNLSEDIRLGRISAFLVYPFGFWSFQTASFLAFQGIQLITALVTLGLMVLGGFLSHWEGPHLLSGLLFCGVASLFWYQVSYLIGLVTLWLEETWVLRVMFAMVAQFLSGAFLPLEMFPEPLVHALRWTPFPYLTYAPVKVFMGQFADSMVFALAILGLWIGILALVTQVVWRRGMRLYTAAGM